MSKPAKFNNVQVALHWIVATALFLMLITGGAILSETPNSDPSKIMGLQVHMSLGALVLLLTLFRLFWRYKTPQPEHVKTGNSLLDKAGVVTHYLLYLFIFTVVFSGIGISVLAGLPNIVFGGVGSLPESFNHLPPHMVHGVVSKVLAALIFLHLGAALFHHFVLKDGLLKRMWFKKID